jgi:hypothetical protein
MDEGRLWEVTLVGGKVVRVRAWTGAEAELKAAECHPNHKPIVRLTKLVEVKK